MLKKMDLCSLQGEFGSWLPAVFLFCLLVFFISTLIFFFFTWATVFAVFYFFYLFLITLTLESCASYCVFWQPQNLLFNFLQSHFVALNVQACLLQHGYLNVNMLAYRGILDYMETAERLLVPNDSDLLIYAILGFKTMMRCFGIT